MDLSLTKAIKLTFDHASLRYEASKKLTAEEWKAYQQIRQRGEAERRHAERLYRDEYQTRVESERQNLLRAAGAKSIDLKPRFTGIDRFDKAALNRQAHRNVRQLHYWDMVKLDKREDEALRALLAQADQRQRPKPAPALPQQTYNNDKKKSAEILTLFRSRPRDR